MSKVEKVEEAFTLESHAERINGKIKDEGGGYRSMIGHHMGPLAYVELPPNHPDVGKKCRELDPEVNGGLTLAEERIYGWDYNHYDNDFDVGQHIKNALEYFRSREKRGAV